MEQPEIQPSVEIKPIKSKKIFIILGFSALLLLGGGIFYYFNFIRVANAFERANMALEKGDTASAEKLYIRALKGTGHVAEAANNLGAIYLQRNDLLKAEEMLRKAIEADPINANAHMNLGLALLGQNKIDESVEMLIRSVEINPKQSLAYYNIGEILFLGGEYDKAYSMYSKAIEHNPDYTEAKRGLAKTEEATNNSTPTSITGKIESIEIILDDGGKIAYAFIDCSNPTTRHWLSGEAENKIISSGIKINFLGEIYVNITNPIAKGSSLIDFSEIKAIPGSCEK